MLPVTLDLEIEGLAPTALRVARLEGEERLTRPYRFEIDTVSTDPALSLEALLLRPARLGLRRGEDQRLIHGLIVAAEESTEAAGDFYAYRFTLMPRLALLAHSTHFRTFGTRTALSVADVVRALLSEPEAAGLMQTDWSFRFFKEEAYPQRDFWLQSDETDLDFLHRLLEHWGIFYYFEQASGHERVVFTDASSLCPQQGADRVLSFDRTGTQTAQKQASVLSVRRQLRTVAKGIHLKTYNYETPHVELTAQADVPKGGAGRVHEVKTYFATAEEGRTFAQARAEAIGAERDQFDFVTTSPFLAPGFFFAFDMYFRPSFNQSYLPIMVSHLANQPVAGAFAEQRSEERGYQNRLRAIPASVPYRSPRETPRPVMTGVSPAKVEAGEGEDGRAILDAQGRYKVSITLNNDKTDRFEGSPYLRMAQPYGGPGGTGMHFPLPDKTEVMIGWMGGDPDRPFIMGALPNPEITSPVTKSNQVQNVVRTPSGISMVMNDGPGKPSAADEARQAAGGTRPSLAGGIPAFSADEVFTAFTIPAYGVSLPHYLRIGDVASTSDIERRIIADPAFGAGKVEFRGFALSSGDYAGMFCYTPGNRTITTAGNHTEVIGGHRRIFVGGTSTVIVQSGRQTEIVLD
ncbi:type VI secretion system Vgr family protein [Acidisoma sp. C75]